MVEKIYTVNEVASALRVDARTVRKLIRAEAIDPSHWFYVGRLIRIKESGLKAIMDDKH